MSAMVASLLILMLPVVLFGLITYWLWTHGIVGRVFLIGIVMCGAVAAHSIIYPQKQLKENYARVIG